MTPSPVPFDPSPPPGPLRPMGDPSLCPEWRPAPPSPRPVYRVLRNWAITALSGFFLCAFGGAVVAFELAVNGEWLAALPALALSCFGIGGLVWERYGG